MNKVHASRPPTSWSWLIIYTSVSAVSTFCWLSCGISSGKSSKKRERSRETSVLERVLRDYHKLLPSLPSSQHSSSSYFSLFRPSNGVDMFLDLLIGRKGNYVPASSSLRYSATRCAKRISIRAMNHILDDKISSCLAKNRKIGEIYRFLNG